MIQQPLVTIVVISYNQGKYINENLESIKNQTYANIELIVADDASTDNSIEIFESWLEENNFLAIKNYHKKNTGLAIVLNECVELASGKYIKMIAADDFLHPESIEKCVNKLETLGKDYGMVFTDTFAIDDSSKIIKDIADYDSFGNVAPEVFRKDLIKGNRIAALTVLLRLDVLKETGKYDRAFLVEDYYRWLKISEKYFIAYIPEKLAYYRLHNSNISKTKEEEINQEAILLSIMFDKNGDNKNTINNFIKRRYLKNKKIDIRLKDAYLSYPFKVKRLGFAMKHKIPPFIFRLLNIY